MAAYGTVGELPTNLFLNPLEEGEEVEFELEKGRSFTVKLVSKPPADATGTSTVIMELNGERWFLQVTDNSVASDTVRREKADKGVAGSVGSPMPGVVVDVKVKAGDIVKEGEQLVVLSAMKMETVIPAPTSGKVTKVSVNTGDKVDGDDLVVTIE